MENNFLTVDDITKILDVSRAAINCWLKDGRLEYCKPGKMRRVRARDLIKYLENLGNSPGAMANFKKDIENYLAQKRIWGKQFKAKLRDLEKDRQR